MLSIEEKEKRATEIIKEQFSVNREGQWEFIGTPELDIRMNSFIDKNFILWLCIISTRMTGMNMFRCDRTINLE